MRGEKRTREALEHAQVSVGAQALEEQLTLRRLAGTVEAFDSDEGTAVWQWGCVGEDWSGHGWRWVGVLVCAVACGVVGFFYMPLISQLPST